MTWNKDRKQTKYGHKRREQMTHTQQNPDTVMSINPRTKEKKEEINNFYSFKGFIYI